MALPVIGVGGKLTSPVLVKTLRFILGPRVEVEGGYYNLEQRLL